MSFEFPAAHSFPPFYTKQINQETLAKQLQLWAELVLSYSRANNIHTLDLKEASGSPLFNNSKIKSNFLFTLFIHSFYCWTPYLQTNY